jgi:hypothetical protein
MSKAVGGAAGIYIEGRRRRSEHLYRRTSAAQRAFISKAVGGAASIYIEGRRRRSEHLYRRPAAAQRAFISKAGGGAAGIYIEGRRRRRQVAGGQRAVTGAYIQYVRITSTAQPQPDQ